MQLDTGGHQSESLRIAGQGHLLPNLSDLFFFKVIEFWLTLQSYLCNLINTVKDAALQPIQYNGKTENKILHRI